jgi:hypothetical protein
LLADSADSFAAAVIRVLRDKELAKTLGTTAAETVREKFGWESVAEQFGIICEQTVTRAKAQLTSIFSATTLKALQTSPGETNDSGPLVETR